MERRPFNQIEVKVSNGGMDKTASVLVKAKGHKVLEIRAQNTTKFMGQLRETIEVVLWNGPALNSGVNLTECPAEHLALQERALEASRFTPEEFVVACRHGL